MGGGSHESVTITIGGCENGIGIDLTQTNVVLDFRPDTPASRASDLGTGLMVGDRILSVDGISLDGRALTSVLQPAESHSFSVERVKNWSGFSIEDTDINDPDDEDDGFAPLDRLRRVTVQKVDGQLGINPEVHCPDGRSAVVKVAKVYPSTRASACGLVSIGDVIISINGQPLACESDQNPLGGAMRTLAEVRDNTDIVLELESDVLLAGWLQKKGEKGFLGLGSKASWSKRWMVLVWSETKMTEREIRYYEGQDYNSRKQRGAIDLTRASSVNRMEVDGAPGIAIETPDRLWELLPASLEEAIEWYTLIQQLLTRKKGLAVVASSASPGLDLSAGEANAPGQLTVLLQRKLGMTINKLGNEIVIAELEPDGAAAACGLLSSGDALDEVNGKKTVSCRQTIQLLTSNPSLAQLKIFSKVVHGGWMHKLGEGLGGWTTRYFTLTYELDPASVPRLAGAGNTAKVDAKLDANRERPRATSIAATGGTSQVLVHLHKANRSDKLGLTLAEDDEGRVVLQRIYEGHVAASAAGLLVGDVLVSVNGKPVANQPTAHRYLSEAVGPLELRIHRFQQSGCWMLRYYDAKNSATRQEKGCIRLSRGTVREINKYSVQDDNAKSGETTRVGLYILQDERCWEMLPPEEELDTWVTKLQLAVFGQEVISTDYVTAEKLAADAARVRDLKGAHYLTLQQQYGLMLATYKDRPGNTAKGNDEGDAGAGAGAGAGDGVYIMSLEMDGAGACSGLLAPDDKVLAVDDTHAESLAQVTKAFRESVGTVKITVASKVVHGGTMLKKGEVHTSLQSRWFLLSDEEDGSVLRYYDSRNAVTRTLKGDIKINAQEVSMVRTFTHEAQGEKKLGVRITTASRVWEIVSPRHDSEARRWAELLNARIRRRIHRPTLSGTIAVSEATEAQALATIGSKEAGIMPESTRL